jgi:hypothetical protein
LFGPRCPFYEWQPSCSAEIIKWMEISIFINNYCWDILGGFINITLVPFLVYKPTGK